MKTEERFEYIYYWYDHLVLRYNGDAKKVAAAIEAKDFDAFMELKRKYSNYQGGVVQDNSEFFPDVIHVWDNEVNEFVGELDVNVRENFNKITHSEYECG